MGRPQRLEHGGGLLTVGNLRKPRWWAMELLERIDEPPSNVFAHWHAMDGADWPTEDQWTSLREADVLDELTDPVTVKATGGTVELAFDLPQPGISFLELVPE